MKSPVLFLLTDFWGFNMFDRTHLSVPYPLPDNFLSSMKALSTRTSTSMLTSRNTYQSEHFTVVDHGEYFSLAFNLTKIALGGHNCGNPSFDEIQMSMDTVQNAVGIDLSESKVTKLEVGLVTHGRKNMRPIIHAFEGLSRKEKFSWETGETFISKRQTLKIYDKFAEFFKKENRGRFPELTEEYMADLVRVEMKFESGWNSYFQYPVKFSTLTEKFFWKENFDRLENLVRGLEVKRHFLPSNIGRESTQRDLKEALTRSSHEAFDADVFGPDERAVG